ncbi:Short C-terminal domain-containing protein [Mycolicibacterium rutilum]|uniref:Short C-terminal domain-containing protein n=1 Tax=Mycolicibacterium rutilum TaxID=370526 RepID=A0A1H6KLP1_MYCRU|nr:SHOCT domain-containing protein [Mycolicibacterium rutilum]SEH74649.1 Short C-terminal domain-containing protein [Mycolicibacterium rutilum]
MSARVASRVAVIVAVVTLVLSVVGFIVTLVLSAFVFDEFDAYGEVPIPGSGTVDLPAGEVTVSFHTVDTGQPTSGFPIPQISVNIEPPPGAADPVVTESVGGTTTVNSDTRVRVWVVDVAQAGAYEVTTDGDVGGYISPRLAFGHGSSYGWLLWLCGALAAVGVVELVAALIWSGRVNKAARPLAPHEVLTVDGPPNLTAVPSISAGRPPSDQGIRLEQLRQLAALRDSGALTEDEFQAEKRRILNQA